MMGGLMNESCEGINCLYYGCVGCTAHCVVCEYADHARQLTKQALRKPAVERLAAQQDEDIQRMADFLAKDSIQRALGCYLESLKKPKQ